MSNEKADKKPTTGPLRPKDSTGKGPLIIESIETKHSTREPLGINSEPKRKSKTLYGYAGSYVVQERNRVYQDGAWYDT